MPGIYEATFTHTNGQIFKTCMYAHNRRMAKELASRTAWRMGGDWSVDQVVWVSTARKEENAR